MPPPSHSASSTLRKTAAQARSQVRLLNTEMNWMFVNVINFPGCSWRNHCSSVHLLSWEGRANALQGEDTHQVCVSEACQGLSSQKGCFQVPHSSGLDQSNLASSSLPLQKLHWTFVSDSISRRRLRGICAMRRRQRTRAWFPSGRERFSCSAGSLSEKWWQKHILR